MTTNPVDDIPRAVRRSLLFGGLILLLIAPAYGAVFEEPSSPTAENSRFISTRGDPCPAGAAVQEVAVVAMNVPISYNNWGDHDPHGRLFVPSQDVDALVEDVGMRLDEAGMERLSGPLRSVAAAVEGLQQDPGEDDQDASVSLRAAVKDQHNAVQEATSRGLGPGEGKDTFRPSQLARPFVYHAHWGDCVRFRLLNALPEPVSMKFSTLWSVPGQGMTLGDQDEDVTPTGSVRSYTVYVPPFQGMEGAHLLQSGADPRYHTKHGLFGAVVAHPPGTVFHLPDGTPSHFGDQGFVQDPFGVDHREFVTFYHDEAELFDRDGPLPLIDPYGAYGPGSKAMNLRAEPFMDRFRLHDQNKVLGLTERGHDKSMGYSSYTYGDPAVYIPRSYVGDPAKWRVLNAGPGQHHVHHLHGGGIRWVASPVAADSQFDIAGEKAVKFNPVNISDSERLDVQNVGPGESYNLYPEGGSGGVQRAVGDFLFHCHIVEHYVAGMWGFWRVYNTLQRDPESGEMALAELPDRAGSTPDPVDSTGLLGRGIPHFGVVDNDTVGQWVESQLPPQGVAKDNDASVWDWKVQQSPAGPLYLGEPETAHVWPNYPLDAAGRIGAGDRPEILFNPEDGRLAYPLLRPHFGERPPFAPGHGPAPYLDAGVAQDPPEDGIPKDDRPDAICPPGYTGEHREYRVTANTFHDFSYQPGSQEGVLNGRAEIFLLVEDKKRYGEDPTQAKSLVLRANQGDCVDVFFTNELESRGETLPKSNIHIHLVQFDVQASDGVVTGFHYEQSVLPLEQTDDQKKRTVTRINGPARHEGGETYVPVEDPKVFLDAAGSVKQGSLVGAGLGTSEVLTAIVKRVEKDHLVIEGRLDLDEEWVGRYIGYEFVRYRWYPDVELGIVYWHDHVDGLVSWQRGLFGGLVVEPARTSWCATSSRTVSGCGESTPTAHVVDVIPQEETEDRSFRELVVQVQDRVCTSSWGCVSFQDPRPPLDDGRLLRPAAFNTRSNPLHDGGFAEYGEDVATDVLEAYAGDDIRIRLLYAGQAVSRGVGTFAVTGHRFPYEQNLQGSRTVDTLTLGISSQHNLRLSGGAGGPCAFAGDYLYFMAGPEMIERGAWGLFRVHEAGSPDSELLPLPGTGHGPDPPSWCTEAPIREYHVTALQAQVETAPGVTVTRDVFVPAQIADRVERGLVQPEPLVLRALQGEAVKVTLENRLARPMGLHASLLHARPGDGLGVPAGANGEADIVASGEAGVYVWYTGDAQDPDLGVVHLQSFSDPVKDPLRGLYGALVVLPAQTDPQSVSSWTGSSSSYRWDDRTWHEQVLLYESDAPWFQGSIMPYLIDVEGHPGVNYRSDPLHERVKPHPAVDVVRELPPDSPFLRPNFQRFGGMGLHSCHIDPQECGRFVPIGFIEELLQAEQPFVDDDKRVLFELRNPSNPSAHAGPEPPRTPLIEAWPGDGLVIRSLSGAGDQPVVHHVAGHHWALDPHMEGCRQDLRDCRSNMVSTVTLGPREVSNAWIMQPGPGGTGDYLWGNRREAFHEGGQWGVLRVQDQSEQRSPDPLLHDDEKVRP